MNYLWQTSGVTRGGTPNIIDYSNAALNPLAEGTLNETVGLGPAATGVAITHWVPATPAAPGAFVQVADGSQPIDWNGDGVATNPNLSFDTNNDSVTGPLAPFDDWKNVKLRGGAIGAAGSYQSPEESSIVEITPAELQLIRPADTTPPQTTASVWPTPNAAGWNRTDVSVTFVATDDISGVARTECDVDLTGTQVVQGPVPITAEGVHGVDYHSVDRSQNVEAAQHFDVRIDKTAPEAVISFDPIANEIVVTGRDELSGVAVTPVLPSNALPIAWTDFGSDVAELRVYQISDRADNKTTLMIKIRCSPQTYEASVLSIRYDDARHAGRNYDRVVPAEGQGRPDDHDRNTIIFERIVGRNDAHPLLGVKQIVSIGDGGSRVTVRARYDVLDDLTLLAHETGSPCCSKRVTTKAAVETDIRGLLLLHIATHNGQSCCRGIRCPESDDFLSESLEAHKVEPRNRHLQKS